MSSESLFSRLARILNQAEIPHLLTGSFAASVYGRIRGSQNVNFIIRADENQIRALFRLLRGNGFSSDLSSALQACAAYSTFNLFDNETALSINFTFCNPLKMSQQEFDRRRSFPVSCGRLSVSTPEDLIITGLEWEKVRGTVRQFEDVVGILKARVCVLDMAYLNSRIEQLGLSEQWAAACDLAGVT